MRRVLTNTAVLFFLITSPLYGATQQVITAGNTDDLNTANTTEYHPFFASVAVNWLAGEQDSSQIIPTAGTFDDLRVFVTNAPNNGAGSQTWKFIFGIDVVSDGYGSFSDTTLTCTITETETTCDNSAGFSVVKGDLVSFAATSTNTPSAADARWTLTWNPTVADESILLHTSGAGARNANSNFPMHGAKANDAATDVNTVMPTAGTFKSMVAWIETDPGTGTDAWTFAFGTVDCTIEDDEAAYPANCNSGADTQAVVAGDVHNLVVTETGTNDSTTMKAGIVFDPTTEGQWIIGHSDDNPTNTSTTQYTHMAAGDSAWGNGESGKRQLAQAGTFATAFTIENIYVQFDADVGTSGDKYRLSLRINQADAGTDLACEVDADVAQRTCNASASNSIANDDQLTIEIDPTGTPNAISGTAISFTAFIPPSVDVTVPANARTIMNGVILNGVAVN